MWSHHFEQYEPLLKGCNTDLIQPIPVSKKEISESIHREQSLLGSQFRSVSLTRWYILFGVALSWFTSYFNSISAEYVLKGSDGDYSYIISVTYIAAVFTPLLMPRILLFLNGSSLIALICIQFMSLSGEILLYAATHTILTHINNIILLYCGRVLVGIALGCNDSCILSILIFWFQRSDYNKSFASAFVYTATIFAMITARASLQPLTSFTFILPIVMSLISIWILFAVNCIKNRNVPPIYDQMILRDFYATDSIWHKCLSIPRVLWLIIANTALTLAVIHVVYTSLLPAILMQMYSFSQHETLIIQVLIAIFFILWSFASSYVMDSYGCHMQWNVASSFLFFVSFLFLFFGAHNSIYAVVSLCVLSISLLFISSHFALIITCCKPIEFAPYCGAIITTLHWALYVAFSDMMAWLHADQRYLDSILFILCLSLLQFVISALVYGIAVKLQLTIIKPAAKTEQAAITTKYNGIYA